MILTFIKESIVILLRGILVAKSKHIILKVKVLVVCQPSSFDKV